MKAYIETFGCQMNENDSGRILYLLEKEGYKKTCSITDADIVIINTCTVREKAKNKLYGHIGNLKKIKEESENMLICIGGCAAQELREKILEVFPFVDIIFGTHNIPELPQLIKKRITTGKSIYSIKQDGYDPDIFKVNRQKSFKAYVPIITGCNNFCSYCIVPLVRGREKSIEADKIVENVRKLAEKGVPEVTLLGQNVNSYGKNLRRPCSFPELLERISDIEGLKRIRFMTSHPKDFSGELISVIKNRKNIAKHIHLPLQAGSDRILKKMNRKYTGKDYLDIIKNIRKEIPECSITTDIIVGFPGEEEKDFLDTLKIVKKAGFSRAFTFIYSPRDGTEAAGMHDCVPQKEKKRWFKELVETQNKISYEENKKLVGRKLEVLVEGNSAGGCSMLEGRLDNNTIVNFKGAGSLIGKFETVIIREAKTFYLMGELIK